MSDDLHRLIYISHSSDLMDAAALERILAASRASNPAIGITGMLLYHDGSFIQVIEGPQASIDKLMQRIRHDRRHGGLIVMASGPVTARVFPSWSMGFVQPDEMTAQQRHGAFDLLVYAADRSIVASGRNATVETQISAFLSVFREFETA